MTKSRHVLKSPLVRQVVAEPDALSNFPGQTCSLGRHIDVQIVGSRLDAGGHFIKTGAIA